MTSIRQFCCNDFLRIGPHNFNTPETVFNTYINLSTLFNWPDLFHVAQQPGGNIAGYIYGTSQGMGDFCHGQVSGISPATSSYVAEALLDVFREHCDKTYKVYFLNMGIPFEDASAQNLAENLGFTKYRRDQNIMEMRLPLPRDVKKKCLKPPKSKAKKFSWKRLFSRT